MPEMVSRDHFADFLPKLAGTLNRQCLDMDTKVKIPTLSETARMGHPPQKDERQYFGCDRYVVSSALDFPITTLQNSGMALEFTTSYLKDSISLFRYYKKLGDGALQQTPDEALLIALDGESNSIATIVKHMTGNMRSRWTDFLTTDGEKPDRHRDTEFEAPPKTRAELMALWEANWKLVFDALTPLTEADLDRSVPIRGEAHSVMQAINRQIGHYAYHVGQIVFLAKHFAGPNWKTLSVPRRKSAEFNANVAAGKASQR
jgi:uncharacterized protein DUF1572